MERVRERAQVSRFFAMLLLAKPGRRAQTNNLCEWCAFVCLCFACYPCCVCHISLDQLWACRNFPFRGCQMACTRVSSMLFLFLFLLKSNWIIGLSKWWAHSNKWTRNNCVIRYTIQECSCRARCRHQKCCFPLHRKILFRWTLDIALAA